LALILAAVSIWLAGNRAWAIEGPTIAGPIGGTDIRSAQLPPPGLYGGLILVGATAFDFVDGKGETIPALSEAHLTKYLAGPFLYYVPDLKLLGGSIGLGGIIPGGEQCGRLFIGIPSDCNTGIGDPYVEIDWSRSFGKVRPSKFPGAFPILQGLKLRLPVAALRFMAIKNKRTHALPCLQDVKADEVADSQRLQNVLVISGIQQFVVRNQHGAGDHLGRRLQ
jgi:hypothetical protein